MFTQLTRELMLLANDYQNKHGRAPIIRNIYVSQTYYNRMCQYFGKRADKYQGYNVMVVLNDDHPDYIILLR